MQGEKTAKGEIQEQLAAAVQRERAAAKKLEEAAAEAESARGRLVKADSALQVPYRQLSIEKISHV